MAIILFTGTPGAGKTLRAVTELRKYIAEGRQLFIHGVPDLKIPHDVVYCRSPDCDVCNTESLEVPQYLFNKDGDRVNQVEVEAAEERLKNVKYIDEWHIWARQWRDANPDRKSVIFFDEVQRVWRPRPSGSKVPAHISMLETHRHYGLDFLLVTQSPSLVDQNVRRLVGQHIHLLRRWDGNYAYEWAECKDSVTGKSGAVRTRYKLDPKVFELYKSSSLHTKIDRKKPFVAYVLPVLLVVVVVMIFLSFRNLNKQFFQSKEEKAFELQQQQQQYSNQVMQQAGQVQPNPSSLTDTVLNQSALPTTHNFDSASYDFTPRIAGVPSTAPAYDNLIKTAISFPHIDHCISYTRTVYPDGWAYVFDSGYDETVYDAAAGYHHVKHDSPAFFYQIDNPKKHYAKLPKGKTITVEPVCHCYTQQHTTYETSLEFCQAYAAGKVFNPYKQDNQSQSVTTAAAM